MQETVSPRELESQLSLVLVDMDFESHTEPIHAARQASEALAEPKLWSGLC